MNKLTYIEARDKIWNAYFRDEIKPADAQFCFCGTLCNNSVDWFNLPLEEHRDLMGYTGKNFVKMEVALFEGVYDKMEDGSYQSNNEEGTKKFEEKLFSGMLAALEVLKQIHRDRGDYIPEDEPLLTKRILIPERII